ncbi:hypothetical protein HXX76_010682 [Chlamydomonas incerta]|uniref:Guanylate cyclase domain-containing protein n=1 Tax=Chlamydomonas incerta TaxID=51695 RepID=A0A835SR92_CHLIN|nr:hypothetical protein HXX76_010682 [Chlamydomonas incerta]|eukprot:KAG2429902.1 hypothetical protein HXX76_010682 [Chlamydomonas incerta]
MFDRIKSRTSLSGSHPRNLNPQHATGCRLWLNRLHRRWQSTSAVLRARPMVLVLVLLLFAIMTTLGIVGIEVAARNAEDQARSTARTGVGQEVALGVAQDLLITTFGAEALATFIAQYPNCTIIDQQFLDMAKGIMERTRKQQPNKWIVKQLEIDQAGVIWRTYPVLTGALATSLYGRDMLRLEKDRPNMLYSIEQGGVHIQGPYGCKEGFQCAYTILPIFLPAPRENFDWGCPYTPYNCSEPCWNATSGMKYWGQVSTMINLDELLKGPDSRLHMLEDRGYLYKLRQLRTSVSNSARTLGNTTRLPPAPEVLPIRVYNLQWVLELAPVGGWVPAWRNPCIAAVVVGSFIVSMLVLWLLVSRAQHDRLLRAMLPDKVIQQLQDGESDIVQQFSNVTILFSDIVGYTTISAELTPLQVVSLLNDLFSSFDELTQKNNVYKVETIGDALMCVSGCPKEEEPREAAARMARMAQDMINCVANFQCPIPGVKLKIRIGLHSGPVVAGVVGKRMPRYCLFGDTVNTASRMESTSLPMRIQISEATAKLLTSKAEFELSARGEVSVKGKGIMNTYWLDSGYVQPPEEGSAEAAASTAAAAAGMAAHTAGGGSSAGGPLGFLHQSLMSSLPPRMRSWLFLPHLPPPSPQQPQPQHPNDAAAAIRERTSPAAGNKSRFAKHSAPNALGPNSGASNFDQLSVGSTGHALDSAAMVVSASLALQQQQRQQQQQQRDVSVGGAHVKDLRELGLLDIETVTSGYGVSTLSACPTTAGGRGSLEQQHPQVHMALGVAEAGAVARRPCGDLVGAGGASPPPSALPSTTATATLEDDSGNGRMSGRSPGTPAAAALD